MSTRSISPSTIQHLTNFFFCTTCEISLRKSIIMVNCLKLNRIYMFLCSALQSNCILTSQNCSILLHQKIAHVLTFAHANYFKNILSFLINFKATESSLMLRCHSSHLSAYFLLSRQRPRAGFLKAKKPVHHSHISGE